MHRTRGLLERWMSLAALALALASAGSCRPRGGTDVGNGATATFDLGAYKKAQATADAVTLENGTRLAEFWISLGVFRLQGGDACEASDGEKLIFDGPLAGDSVRRDVLREASEPVPVELGPYCRLRVNLEPVGEGELPEGAPAELEEAVVWVRGARADGTPFTLRTTRIVGFSLDAKDRPFVLDRGNTPLVVAFDMEGAVMALDLDALQGSPEIVIDERTNVSALSQFENSLRKSASLFVDLDEDGVLSAEEGSPSRALAQGQIGE